MNPALIALLLLMSPRLERWDAELSDRRRGAGPRERRMLARISTPNRNGAGEAPPNGWEG